MAWSGSNWPSDGRGGGTPDQGRRPLGQSPEQRDPRPRRGEAPRKKNQAFVLSFLKFQPSFMLRYGLLLCLIALLSCFSSLSLEANDATEAFKREKLGQNPWSVQAWQKATQNLDYQVAERKPKPEPKIDVDLPNAPSPPSAETWAWLASLGSLLKWLFIILSLGLMALLVFKLAGGRWEWLSKNRKNDKIDYEELEKIEANLDQANVQPLLERAVQSRNWRLALRLNYLQTIQELNEKGYLVWKRDKTNGTYLRELQKYPELSSHFATLTRIFEFVWFGQNDNAAQRGYQRSLQLLQNIQSLMSKDPIKSA